MVGSANKGGIFQSKTRYVILFLGSACIASIASNYTILGFTYICMSNVTVDENNATAMATRGQYDYTQKEKSFLHWSLAVGTLLAAWPFQWFYQKYGARDVFFIAGVISALSTSLMPLMASIDFKYFLAMRFLQGVSFGADFAAIGLIVVHWASLKQHGFFISLLSSFSQISVMFTMPVSGLLCNSSWGWQSAYYVHGALCMFLFSLWWWYYRNDPVDHPKMTEVELEKIQRGKKEEELGQHEAVPVGAILRDPVVWSVWLSAFGELMMSQFIVLYGPTFIKEVLNFSVGKSAMMVAMPRFVHLCFKIISGHLSDKIKFLSEKTKMIIFNTISLMVSGFFFCVLGFIPKEQAFYSIVILFIIEATTGCICGGFYKCATLVARQHSHFVLSAIQFIKCLSLFIEPTLIFIFCRNNTLAEWRIVFLIHGGLLIGGNIIFCFFATDKPAKFTYTQADETDELKQEPEKQRLTDAPHE